MAKFKLIRHPISETSDAVKGHLMVCLPKFGWVFICNTLENKQYLIPQGKYPVSTTFSPKFKRNLPLLSNVKNRLGIRVHRGTKPQHSRGCILVNDRLYEDIVMDFISDDSASEMEVTQGSEPAEYHHYGKER